MFSIQTKEPLGMQEWPGIDAALVKKIKACCAALASCLESNSDDAVVKVKGPLALPSWSVSQFAQSSLVHQLNPRCFSS
jgi:hypothetical protein